MGALPQGFMVPLPGVRPGRLPAVAPAHPTGVNVNTNSGSISSVRTFSPQMAESKGVKVGDKFPDIEVDQGFPPEKVNLAKKYADKTFVLVGLPGAFTPT